MRRMELGTEKRDQSIDWWRYDILMMMILGYRIEEVSMIYWKSIVLREYYIHMEWWYIEEVSYWRSIISRRSLQYIGLRRLSYNLWGEGIYIWDTMIDWYYLNDIVGGSSIICKFGLELGFDFLEWNYRSIRYSYEDLDPYHRMKV
jgi:hypothetical protein